MAGNQDCDLLPVVGTVVVAGPVELDVHDTIYAYVVIEEKDGTMRDFETGPRRAGAFRVGGTAHVRHFSLLGRPGRVAIILRPARPKKLQLARPESCNANNPIG